jgi:hypothetical protein
MEVSLQRAGNRHSTHCCSPGARRPGEAALPWGAFYAADGSFEGFQEGQADRDLSLFPTSIKRCFQDAREIAALKAQWLALLIFAAAAKHLKYRDRWIGWTDAQRERRLPLVVNNIRFLLLPDRTFPNLGSRVLRMVLARLSSDWQVAYGHPVVVVETFVDPEQFCGTVYTANGWEELGKTDGSGRHQRDYYVRHDKPKRLFVRELCRNARGSLQAEQLKPALAMVEAKAGPKSRHTVKEIGSIIDYLKQTPDFRKRVESYPLWSLLAICLLAVLCGAPRGSKD